MHLIALLISFLIPLSAFAEKDLFQIHYTQKPTVQLPQKGSVIGDLAHTDPSIVNESLGSFVLPLGFALPTDRGPLLLPSQPSYSPGFGLSWLGHGWDWNFSITRHRVEGLLDFATDDLKTPWGVFLKSKQGGYEPSGMGSAMRLIEEGPNLLVTDSQGTVFTFAPLVQGPRGTYGWFLIQAQDIFGSMTRVDYELNPSGQPFPKSITYGGYPDPEYTLTFDYRPGVFEPFVDYRSGTAKALDRVLFSLIVASKKGGSWVERERYLLNHGFQTHSLRPFLEKVERRFPNGEIKPAHTFTYGSIDDHLAKRRFEDLPARWEPIITGRMNEFKNGASLVDVREDGLPDIEIKLPQHTWDRVKLDGSGVPHRENNTYTFDSPFDVPTDVCQTQGRPSPRLLMRLFGTGTPLFELRPYTSGDVFDPIQKTYVQPNPFVVCTEDRKWVGILPLPPDQKFWRYHNNTRFAPLSNKPGRPDIVAISSGHYHILQNRMDPAQPNHLHFSPVSSGPLFYPNPHAPGEKGNPARPSTLHVADLNGDGILDLVAVEDDVIFVWYGRGDLTFEPIAQRFMLFTHYNDQRYRANGLLESQLHFVDINGDGLTDIVVETPDNRVWLMMNTGTSFVRHELMPKFHKPLESVIFSGYDFLNTGNFQVLFRSALFEVNQPGIGLLSSANDGTGNRLHFTYTRAPRQPGLQGRPVVLQSINIFNGGETPRKVDYSYGSAKLHSQSRHLLGFDSVTTTTPLRKVLSSFWHTDTQTGLLLAQETVHTLLPNVVSFLKRSLDEVKGPTQTWWRLKKEEAGLKNAWGTGATTTLVQSTKEYTRYEKDICPVEVAETSPAGTLVSTTTLTSPRGLQGAHHCLPGQVSLQGRHTNSAFDFAHSLSIERNDKGQTTSLVDDTGALLQKMGYNELGQLTSFQELGTLPFLFTYAKGLITQVTDPSGPVTQYAYDATKDTLTHVREARGQGEYYRSYNYDAFGRLKESFAGLSHSTLQKALTVNYTWSKDTTPGLVIEENTVAPGRTHVAASYFTSSGKEAFGAAPNGEGQWVTSPRAQHRTGEEATITLPPTQAPSAQALGSQEWASLLSAAYSLSTTQEGGLGAPFFTKSTLQQGVNQETANTWELSGQHLIQKTITNGDLIATRLIGGSGLVEALIQPTGERTGFGYDAAGRLRAVTLADGSEHRVSYTPKGQIACSERVGLAKLCHTYNAQYQLETSTLVDAKGALQTTFTQSYDALGRITATTTHAPGKKTEVVAYFYDGMRPSKPKLENQQGFLTAIEGPGYTKEFVYRVDGLPLETHLRVGAYTYSQFTSYSELGHVLEVTTTLTGSGGVNHMDTRQPTFDALGRPTGYNRNGKPFVEMAYDAWNRVSSVQIADLTAPSWQGLFDPVTFGLKGYSSPATHVSHSWRLNGKGFVEQETTQNKGATTTKSHTFSERGYLDSTVVATPEGNKSYSYTYNEAGYSEAWLEAREGSKGYTFDSLGRITANQGHTFTYAASGHIERAQTPQGTFTYTYDEGGQRLAKWDSQGNLVVLYLPGGVILEGTTVYEPVIAGKTLLGVLKNGVFHSVQTDIRGTPALTPYSPYGVREGESSISPVVMDYTQKSFDPALKTVRMGVRDYAPELGSFAQPDLAVFLEPNMCLKSVVDCTLFSYGNNNPVIFTDPTGKFAQIVPFVIIASLSSLPVDTRYDSYARDQLNHAPLNIKLGTYTYETIIGRELLTGRELAPEERWMGFLNGGAAYFNSKIPGFNLIFNGKNKNNGNSKDVDEGTRPPNLSPDRAGRRGAFREAKRQSGIPVSRQPDRVIKNYDRHGKEINPGRQYKWLKKSEDIIEYSKNKNVFDDKFWKDPINPDVITIRDDSRGHYFGPNDPENRGPHFNDGMKNHYDY